jgi:SAM-dependent methyltransferase
VSAPIERAGALDAAITAYEPHEVAWTPEKVKLVWDFYASGEVFHGSYFTAHSGAAIVQRIDREVGLEGKRILDFGCARGDLLSHLLARGYSATGLEFSEGLARMARERLEGMSGFEGVVVAERPPSELPDGAFDVVLLIEIVERLLDEQIAPTFAEVRRLLAPGGSVVITTPYAEPVEQRYVRCPDCGATFHRWQHVRSLDEASGRLLLAEHGFEPQTAEGVFWGLTRLQLLRHRLARRPMPHLLLSGVKPAGGR